MRDKELGFQKEHVALIDVAKDFHIRSVHQKIEPVLMYITSRRFSFLSVRIAGHDIPATLQTIGETWQRFEDKYPFEYEFPDATFAQYYQQEERLTQTLGIFSMLAICIACLGLFGLPAHDQAACVFETYPLRFLGKFVYILCRWRIGGPSSVQGKFRGGECLFRVGRECK